MNKKIIIGVVIFTILLRVFFILKADMAEYQFDFGLMELSDIESYDRIYKDYDKDGCEARHINYIMQLYFFNTHPHILKGQFYHPPLHHFILANWLRIMDKLSNNSMIKLESMQFVSLIYSLIILYTFKKILDELEIENQALPITLFAFYPLMIFMSGSLNNDQLATLFSIVTLLYLLKWRKDPSIKNTIIGSLMLGLGLMTKESSLVMLIPMVFIYFKDLSENVEQDKKIGKLLIEIILVVLIVVPLGFWFHIYMNGESLGIIQPYEYLSLKEATIHDRFGISNPFIFKEKNIWSSLIYTSINYNALEFGFVVKLLVLLDLVLLLEWLYYFIKNKKDLLLVVTSISWWFGYFYLNITMPYISSMNARYMVVPLMIGIIDIGKGFDKEENSNIKKATIITIVSICICSIIYFISL